MLTIFRSWIPDARVVLAGALLGGWLISSPAAADTATGAELFHTLKCQLCHSVPAAGIEAKAKSDKVKGADLGTAAAELTAEAMISYVRRETEIDDKQHKKEFKGTDEELAAIVDWLLELSRQAKEAAPAEDGSPTGRR